MGIEAVYEHGQEATSALRDGRGYRCLILFRKNRASDIFAVCFTAFLPFFFILIVVCVSN